MIFRGDCWSACTILLRNPNACAEPNVRFMFHAGSLDYLKPETVKTRKPTKTERENDKRYIALSPPKVRKWMRRNYHRFLVTVEADKYVALQGEEMRHIVPVCKEYETAIIVRHLESRSSKRTQVGIDDWSEVYRETLQGLAAFAGSEERICDIVSGACSSPPKKPSDKIEPELELVVTLAEPTKLRGRLIDPLTGQPSPTIDEDPLIGAGLGINRKAKGSFIRPE